MIDAAVDLLTCPVCGQDLAAAGTTLRCPAGHSFDVARQGYVNLVAGGSPHAGDTAEMVAARRRFVDGGWYLPVSDAVARAAASAPAGPVLDLGAGTGHYLAAVLDADPSGASRTVGLALDVSVYAARRAARCHPRAGAAVADTWRPLPVRDGAVTAVLDVFAPRNVPEVARVLRPGGVLVVATPGPGHLAELRSRLGLLDVEPDKDERLAQAVSGHLEAAGEERVGARLRLPREAAVDLVAMGPSARHTGPEALAALPADGLEVTVEVWVRRYRRQP